MNTSLQILYNQAMGSLMREKATTHGCFFTQKEFEENRAKIFEITNAKSKLQESITKKE